MHAHLPALLDYAELDARRKRTAGDGAALAVAVRAGGDLRARIWTIRFYLLGGVISIWA